MNTPEKAADELIEKYRQHTSGCDYFYCYEDSAGEIKKAIQCAIIDVTGKIELLEQLHKPEYTTFITQREPEVETMDGYELKDFWNAVLTNLKSR